MKNKWTNPETEEDGSMFTKEDWADIVRDGACAPDDGSGYWADINEYDTNYDAFGPAPEWATHVAWYNK